MPKVRCLRDLNLLGQSPLGVSGGVDLDKGQEFEVAQIDDLGDQWGVTTEFGTWFPVQKEDVEVEL